MFQKNHVRKQGLEHVHVPVLFLFLVNPEHSQHWLGHIKISPSSIFQRTLYVRRVVNNGERVDAATFIDMMSNPSSEYSRYSNSVHIV